MGEARGGWGAIVAAAVLAATLVGVGALGPPAGAGAPVVATTIEVTTTDDVVDGGDGETSLREAFAEVTAGEGDHAIVLAIGGDYVLDSCNGTDRSLVRDQPDAGAPSLVVHGRGSTIEQTCANSRVITANTDGLLVLRDLTITGGRATAGAAGFDVGGGIKADGVVNLYDSRVVDNVATQSGGGIEADQVLLTRSVVADNTASLGDGGGINAVSNVGVVRSTVSGNQAPEGQGGGVRASAGNVSVIAGTTTENEADGAAAILAANVSLDRATIYRDGPGTAAIRTFSSGASFLALSSIVASESTVDCVLGGTSSPGHFNYSGDDTCGFGGSDRVDAGLPALAPLGENGGPTPTLLPVAGAGPTDVRDAIPAADGHCSPTSSDQRHVERPQGAGCEIGAVEIPNPFGDVPAASPFFMEIAWMDEIGLSTGYADGGFHPADGVSRQAMAAFLYRFAGQPEGPFPDPGFPDVPDDAPFFDEISWLADSGITGGYADGTFKPASSVSRQAMAAFIYRFREEPPFAAPAEATFPDVPTDHPFFTEIEWMAFVGVSSGYADGTWKPGANVSRQAMARFLFVVLDRLGA